MKTRKNNQLLSDYQSFKEFENSSQVTIGEYLRVISQYYDYKNNIYNKKWIWKEKIIFILSNEKIGLTTRQIVESITNHEPKLIENRRKIILIVSGILQSCLKAGVLKRHKSGNKKEFIYGLPDWFDKDNVMLKDFK